MPVCAAIGTAVGPSVAPHADWPAGRGTASGPLLPFGRLTSGEYCQQSRMYHAFISYSHVADSRLAPVLQRALERLGSPWWRRAPVKIFRDDASMPASAALWPAIEAGLVKSEYFVLLASTQSAASPWVDKEVAWWLQNRPRERLLIAVTSGTIVFNATASDFDWVQTNCLPPALRGVFASEPFWTDLRFVRGPEELSPQHSGFRNAALGLAAAIRGVAKDDLERVDIRERRKAMQLAWGTAGLMGTLALATAGAVWVARSQSVSARTNHLQAESRRLAAEALTQLDGGRGIETATLKAALAWRLAPTDDARRVLHRIDQETPDVSRILHQHTQSPARLLAFSRDDRRLATVSNDGLVLLWSLADGRQVGVPMASERQSVREIRFSRDGSHMLVRGMPVYGSPSPAPTLAVFRLADGARLPIDDAWRAALSGTSNRPNEEVSRKDACVALSPSGARLAVGRGATVTAIDVTPGSAAPTTIRLPPTQQVIAMGFADDSRLHVVLAGGYGDGIRAGRIDLPQGRLTLGPVLRSPGGYCGFTTVADSGDRIAVLGSAGEGLQFLELDARLGLHALPMPQPVPRMPELTGHHAPDLDAAGQRFAYGIMGVGYIWEPGTRRLLKTLPKMAGGHGPPLALSASGRLVAALDGDTPVVWELAGEQSRRITGSRCGAGQLEDACIQRLCERLTEQIDDKQTLALLGAGANELLPALRGARCAAQGEAPAQLQR